MTGQHPAEQLHSMLTDLASGTALFRVQASPRYADDGAGIRQSFVAVVGAFSRRRPLITMWHRPTPGAPLDLLVAADRSRHVEANDQERPVVLDFPPGGRGHAVPGSEVLGHLNRFTSWVTCVGMFDHLLRENQPVAEETPGTTSEDALTYLLDDAFVWLVCATPRPPEDISSELLSLRLEIPTRRNQAVNSEQARLECERSEARYRELSAARASGTWAVQVIAGARTPEAADRVACLLCSSSDLGTSRYVLVPGPPSIDLNSALGAYGKSGEDSSPIVMTSTALAALVRVPRTEVAGLRLSTSPTFDVTPEVGDPRLPEDKRQGLVPLGGVLDKHRQVVGSFALPLDSVNRHVFVCGATGGGKSQTVRTLLQGLPHDIHWLVIEPAKAEYARAMAGRLDPDAPLLLRPGDPDRIAVGLNPLEPAPGYPLQSHLDLVRALFLAAFQADEPFPQIIAQALTRSYEECGWDLLTGDPSVPWATAGHQPAYPTLGHLQQCAQRVVADIGYGAEITRNMRGVVDVRIGSLRTGTPGRFLEGGHPLDIEHLLEHNAVLEIENVTNDEDKAFLMGTVLIRLVEHLRVRHRPSDRAVVTDEKPTLRHVTVIEEAHRLLRKVDEGRASSHAIELFASLLAEIRAYGEGIVIAEQIPAKLIPDAIKNTACKVVHRLPAADDRELVGATMNLTSEQSEYVVSLTEGHAAVFADGMDRPCLARMPDRTEDEKRGSTLDDSNIPAPRALRPALSACPQNCGGALCTLRAMREADAVLRDLPAIELWLDVLTFNHVAGYVTPPPDRRWCNAIAEEVRGERLLNCAIARAASRSVDARRPWLIRTYDPDELAKHLTVAALSGLRGGSTCGADCAKWRAGARRLTDIAHALHSTADRDVPHPDTEQWKERGIDLHDLPATEQLVRIQYHPDRNFPHARLLEIGGDPSRLGILLKQTVPRLAPDEMLTKALRFLGGAASFPDSVKWASKWLTEEWATEPKQPATSLVDPAGDQDDPGGVS